MAFDSISEAQIHNCSTGFIGSEEGFFESGNDIEDVEGFASQPELRAAARGEHYIGAESDFFHLTFKVLKRRYQRIVRCPYCREKLLKPSWEETADSDEEYFACLWVCPGCAWWFGSLYANDYQRDDAYACGVSRMRRFGHQIPPECSSELSQYVRRHPDFLHRIDPTRLELLVADVFKANRRGGEVTHVGKPGDRGVDVLYVDEGENDWLIQVRRRTSPRKSETFKTIQELQGAILGHAIRKANLSTPREDFSATLANRSVHGIVVSTATRFTRGAVNEVNAMLDQGVIIKLIDKGLLLRMLQPTLPKEPWKKFIQQTFCVFGNPVFSELPKSISKGLRLSLRRVRAKSRQRALRSRPSRTRLRGLVTQ